MEDDEDILSSMSGDYDLDLILPSLSEDGDDEGENDGPEEGIGADADDADSEEGNVMLGGRAAGLVAGRLPEAYLQGAGDAPSALARVQAPAEASALASCMQSPGLRAGKTVINTHNNKLADFLSYSPSHSRVTIQYPDSNRQLHVKAANVQVCPLGGKYDQRRLLLSGKDTSDQAVLVTSGRYTGQVGVVPAGYMGTQRPKVTLVDRETGAQHPAVNVEAARLHAVSASELGARAFSQQQADAIRSHTSSASASTSRPVPWSIAAAADSSGVVGGVQQAAQHEPVGWRWQRGSGSVSGVSGGGSGGGSGSRWPFRSGDGKRHGGVRRRWCRRDSGGGSGSRWPFRSGDGKRHGGVRRRWCRRDSGGGSGSRLPFRSGDGKRHGGVRRRGSGGGSGSRWPFRSGDGKRHGGVRRRWWSLPHCSFYFGCTDLPAFLCSARYARGGSVSPTTRTVAARTSTGAFAASARQSRRRTTTCRFPS
ncbi:hypothetical protein Agub_g12075 [Astrephomene gubernaculifera]|uniref:Uncharacterized protein n=1 Tax=Astrephomene gubernaculifera TaxID=47775 RepID=A0AAD3DXT7_9CHLO|nr:hypothetical protein Agub_g12075 [Astrephomene gubernaculifera]